MKQLYFKAFSYGLLVFEMFRKALGCLILLHQCSPTFFSEVLLVFKKIGLAPVKHVKSFYEPPDHKRISMFVLYVNNVSTVVKIILFIK